MNTYKEKWNYELTSSSSPYGINNGSPYFSSGLCHFPRDSFINKDFNGSPFEFKGNNYVGSYAISFDLDISLASYNSFIILIYGGSNCTPCIYKSGDYALLGWSKYSDVVFDHDYDNGSNATGNFNGTEVSEQGTYRVIFIKDQNTSSIAMCVVSPSGVKYRTLWKNVIDYHNHIQIGNNTLGGNDSEWIIGTILVNDDLNSEDILNIYNSCELASVPTVTIQPLEGIYQEAVTVTLIPADDVEPGWNIKYTVDGSSPSTSNGSSYVEPFIVGSPFIPDSTVSVKAAYVNDISELVGPISSKSYSFALKPPLFKFNGYSADSVYGTGDILINWIDSPVSGTTEIVYTVDGSDPETSGTAVVWSPGNKIQFNSHPIDPGINTPSLYQINAPLIAATRYIPDGSLSEKSSTQVSFYLDYAFIPFKSSKFNDDISYMYTYSSNGTSAEYIYDISIDNNHTLYTGYAPISIPFDNNTHVVRARISTLDGSLYTDAYAYNPSISFYQKPPYIKNKSIVSSIPVFVEPYNQNGINSTMYYTIDGSTPTQSSQILSSGIYVPVSGILKLISTRNNISSEVTKFEVLPEYEITEVATSLESSNYHYHIAAQRTSLNNRLSPSNIQVSVGSSITPSGVTANIYGNDYQISQWDSGNYMGYTNSFSGVQWRSYQTSIRSRLAYTNAAFNIDWEYNKDLFLGRDKVDIFKFIISSRIYKVLFIYTIDIDTSMASITKTYIDANNTNINTEITQSGIISTSGDNTIILGIEPGTVSFNDLHLIVEESRPELLGDIKWNIEMIVNPGEINLSAPDYNGKCIITTISDNGYLLMAPGSVICSKNTSLVNDTIDIDFRNKDSIHKIKHSILTEEQDIYPPAVIGYDNNTKTTKIDGQFVLAMPGIIDTNSDFDSEIDVSTDFLSLMTYPDNNVGQETLPAITMFLADPASQLNSKLSVDVGISLRMYVPNDRIGAYPVYLELYSYGYSPNRLTLSSNSKQIKFKISNRQSVISLSAVIDGIETLLTTINSISGRYKEVRLMRTGATRQPRKQLTDILKYRSEGVFNRVICSSPVLIGADFMFRGVATGFSTTNINMQGRNISALWFNPINNTVSSEEISFEPSDGRLLIGILENDDGNLLWTNTMYSTLIKVRTELNGSLTGGTIIGVGSNLKIKNGQVIWTENGHDKNTAIGDLRWVRPNSYLDLANNRQIIKVLEKQKVKITGASIP